MSCDCDSARADTSRMQKSRSETAFSEEFQRRVKLARHARGYTQKKIAGLLGMEQDKYKQYETRDGTLLPHEHLHLFCELTGASLHWLFTGEGQAPMKLPTEPRAPRHRRAARGARGEEAA